MKKIFRLFLLACAFYSNVNASSTPAPVINPSSLLQVGTNKIIYRYYGWSNLSTSKNNAVFSVPSGLTGSFSCTLAANPKTDFLISLYSPSATTKNTSFGGAIELAFGGWGNTKSAVRYCNTITNTSGGDSCALMTDYTSATNTIPNPGTNQLFVITFLTTQGTSGIVSTIMIEVVDTATGARTTRLNIDSSTATTTDSAKQAAITSLFTELQTNPTVMGFRAWNTFNSTPDYLPGANDALGNNSYSITTPVFSPPISVLESINSLVATTQPAQTAAVTALAAFDASLPTGQSGATATAVTNLKSTALTVNTLKYLATKVTSSTSLADLLTFLATQQQPANGSPSYMGQTVTDFLKTAIAPVTLTTFSDNASALAFKALCTDMATVAGAYGASGLLATIRTIITQNVSQNTNAGDTIAFSMRSGIAYCNETAGTANGASSPFTMLEGDVITFTMQSKDAGAQNYYLTLSGEADRLYNFNLGGWSNTTSALTIVDPAQKNAYGVELYQNGQMPRFYIAIADQDNFQNGRLSLQGTISTPSFFWSGGNYTQFPPAGTKLWILAKQITSTDANNGKMLIAYGQGTTVGNSVAFAWISPAAVTNLPTKFSFSCYRSGFTLSSVTTRSLTIQEQTQGVTSLINKALLQDANIALQASAYQALAAQQSFQASVLSSRDSSLPTSTDNTTTSAINNLKSTVLTVATLKYLMSRITPTTTSTQLLSLLAAQQTPPSDSAPYVSQTISSFTSSPLATPSNATSVTDAQKAKATYDDFLAIISACGATGVMASMVNILTTGLQASSTLASDTTAANTSLTAAAQAMTAITSTTLSTADTALPTSSDSTTSAALNNLKSSVLTVATLKYLIANVTSATTSTQLLGYLASQQTPASGAASYMGQSVATLLATTLPATSPAPTYQSSAAAQTAKALYDDIAIVAAAYSANGIIASITSTLSTALRPAPADSGSTALDATITPSSLLKVGTNKILYRYYGWSKLSTPIPAAQSNATFSVPSGLVGSFSCTLAANPKTDFLISLYSPSAATKNATLKNAFGALAPQGGAIELAFGGWGNTKSAIRYCDSVTSASGGDSCALMTDYTNALNTIPNSGTNQLFVITFTTTQDTAGVASSVTVESIDSATGVRTTRLTTNSKTVTTTNAIRQGAINTLFTELQSNPTTIGFRAWNTFRSTPDYLPSASDALGTNYYSVTTPVFSPPLKVLEAINTAVPAAQTAQSAATSAVADFDKNLPTIASSDLATALNNLKSSVLTITTLKYLAGNVTASTTAAALVSMLANQQTAATSPSYAGQTVADFLKRMVNPVTLTTFSDNASAQEFSSVCADMSVVASAYNTSGVLPLIFKTLGTLIATANKAGETLASDTTAANTSLGAASQAMSAITSTTLSAADAALPTSTDAQISTALNNLKSTVLTVATLKYLVTNVITATSMTQLLGYLASQQTPASGAASYVGQPVATLLATKLPATSPAPTYQDSATAQTAKMLYDDMAVVAGAYATNGIIASITSMLAELVKATSSLTVDATAANAALTAATQVMNSITSNTLSNADAALPISSDATTSTALNNLKSSVLTLATLKYLIANVTSSTTGSQLLGYLASQQTPASGAASYVGQPVATLLATKLPATSPAPTYQDSTAALAAKALYSDMVIAAGAYATNGIIASMTSTLVAFVKAAAGLGTDTTAANTSLASATQAMSTITSTTLSTADAALPTSGDTTISTALNNLKSSALTVATLKYLIANVTTTTRSTQLLGYLALQQNSPSSAAPYLGQSVATLLATKLPAVSPAPTYQDSATAQAAKALYDDITTVAAAYGTNGIIASMTSILTAALKQATPAADTPPAGNFGLIPGTLLKTGNTNIIYRYYGWNKLSTSQNNVTFNIPAGLTGGFSCILAANPKTDFLVSLYSPSAAAKNPSFGGAIEMAFGGWNNAQSAMRYCDTITNTSGADSCALFTAYTNKINTIPNPGKNQLFVITFISTPSTSGTTSNILFETVDASTGARTTHLSIDSKTVTTPDSAKQSAINALFSELQTAPAVIGFRAWNTFSANPNYLPSSNDALGSNYYTITEPTFSPPLTLLEAINAALPNAQKAQADALAAIDAFDKSLPTATASDVSTALSNLRSSTLTVATLKYLIANVTTSTTSSAVMSMLAAQQQTASGSPAYLGQTIATFLKSSLAAVTLTTFSDYAAAQGYNSLCTDTIATASAYGASGVLSVVLKAINDSLANVKVATAQTGSSAQSVTDSSSTTDSNSTGSSTTATGTATTSSTQTATTTPATSTPVPAPPVVPVSAAPAVTVTPTPAISTAAPVAKIVTTPAPAAPAATDVVTQISQASQALTTVLGQANTVNDLATKTIDSLQKLPASAQATRSMKLAKSYKTQIQATINNIKSTQNSVAAQSTAVTTKAAITRLTTFARNVKTYAEKTASRLTLVSTQLSGLVPATGK